MIKAFILGNPRSGTSLLRLMLGSHSSICAPPEAGFLQWLNVEYYNWVWKDSESTLRFIESLSQTKKIETWQLDYHKLAVFIDNFKPNNYSELMESIYLYYSLSNGKYPRVIVDKNNYFIAHMDLLNNVWEDAKFIFIIRDGRDVACSYKNLEKLETSSTYKPKLSVKIEEIAAEWNNNNQEIFAFLKKIPADKSIFVKYEDLIKNTEAQLREICSFVNLPFDENMLSYYDNQLVKEPISTIDWKKKTLGPPDTSSIGRYKIELTKKEVEIFESIASDALTLFNYI